MREIKFRAWDKAKQIMLKPFTFWSFNTDLNNGRLYVDSHKIYEDDIVWMQYTGLKDKNGKEIYEGDIVTINDSRPKSVYWYKEGGEYRVGHRGEKTQLDKTTTLFFNSVMKVIGNIYENKDLIDGY